MQQLASRATFVAGAVLLLAISLNVAQASIDSEPVKVTHRNSGPSYHVSSVLADNEVEKTPVRSMQEAGEQPAAGTSDEPATGHLTIRRIFLMPIRAPMEPDQGASHEEPPNPFRLLSLFPASGQNSPSPMFNWHQPGYRAPMQPYERPASFGEREETQERPDRDQLIDPIHMMLAMLRQTLQAAMAERNQPVAPSREPSTELDKDSSVGSELFRPLVGDALDKANKTDETKEEVIEIGGKKFLKKVVLTKHVGNNMFFVTRRLFLSPLNETAETETGPVVGATSTTTISPSASTAGESASAQPSFDIEPKVTELTSSSSEATSTSTTTTAPPTEQPSSTTVASPVVENKTVGPESVTPAIVTERSEAPSTTEVVTDKQ